MKTFLKCKCFLINKKERGKINIKIILLCLCGGGCGWCMTVWGGIIISYVDIRNNIVSLSSEEEERRKGGHIFFNKEKEERTNFHSAS